MKKRWILLLFCLVGCNNNEEALMVKENSSIISEQVRSKVPVYWSVSLRDGLTDEIYPVVMNEFGYFHDNKYDEEAFRQLAREIAAKIDSPMEHPRWNEEGKWIPGKARVILSEAELVDQLQHLPIGVTETTLPIEIYKPVVTEEEAQGIDEKVIGEFTSYFNPHVKGRSHNIGLSAKEISNVILGPGESFSFNQTVGERTKNRGYQEAMEIVNKEFVVGIGGGICQTSSTLFNAVDAANLEMVERFTHSRNVGYVTSGRDATVSWGGPDFQFLNPHPFPILIRSKVNLDKGEIQVTVHTHESRRM